MVTAKKTLVYFLILFILPLTFFVTSYLDLYKDVINPDGINWHTRSINFIQELSKKHYSNTFQVYHPGVTLMWITGPVLTSLQNYFVSQGIEDYSKDTFLYYDLAAKLALIIFATITLIVSLLYLKRLTTTSGIIIFSLLFVLEPLVIGERRLYHLDYLMTSLLFVSLLAYYFYFFKNGRFYHLILGCLFFSMAILTKTTAVVFLPAPLGMIIFGKMKFFKRLISLPALLLLICLFIFGMFPAMWKDPIKSVPSVIKKVTVGVKDIGYEGKKEFGYSGAQESVILDKTVDTYKWYFYLQAMAFRSTHGAWVLATAAILSYAIYIFKFLVTEILRIIRKQKTLDQEDNVWLGIFSILVAYAFFIALTISTKKLERYVVVMIPFIYLTIALAFQKIRTFYAFLLAGVFIFSLIPQYLQIHPYYIAYGNPLLGGVKGKYDYLESPPFGIATYQKYKALYANRGDPNIIHTVTGNKSLKAISYGFRFTKSPNCSTEFYVAFVNDPQPFKTCGKGYALVDTVSVGNMNYWNIYKKMKPIKNTDILIQ